VDAPPLCPEDPRDGKPHLDGPSCRVQLLIPVFLLYYSVPPPPDLRWAGPMDFGPRAQSRNPSFGIYLPHFLLLIRNGQAVFPLSFVPPSTLRQSSVVVFPTRTASLPPFQYPLSSREHFRIVSFPRRALSLDPWPLLLDSDCPFLRYTVFPQPLSRLRPFVELQAGMPRFRLKYLFQRRFQGSR